MLHIRLVFEKMNLPPVLDTGRLILSNPIGVIMSTNLKDELQIKFRNVFLFETCLLIIAIGHSNKSDNFKIIDKISIYDIRSVKRSNGDNMNKYFKLIFCIICFGIISKPPFKNTNISLLFTKKFKNFPKTNNNDPKNTLKK